MFWQVLQLFCSYLFTDGGITVLATFTLALFYLHPTYVVVLGFIVCATCSVIFLRHILHIFEIGGTAALDEELDKWKRAATNNLRQKIKRYVAAGISISGFICLTIARKAIFAGILSVGLFIIGQLVAMWTWKCRHVDDCVCFVGLISEAEVQARYVDLREAEALRAFRDQANKRCYHVQDGGCLCHIGCKKEEYADLLRRLEQCGFLDFEHGRKGGKRNWVTHPINPPYPPVLPFSPTSNPSNQSTQIEPGPCVGIHADIMPVYKRMQAGDEGLMAEVERRRQDEETYQKNIRTLKEQLEYAKRVTDPEREAMSQKLSHEKLQVQQKDKRIEKLAADNRWLKYVYGEKVNRPTVACDEKEVCEREKAEWRQAIAELKAQLNQHNEYVQEAAKRLGWQDQIGPYVDVKDYVSQSVLFALNFARQHPQVVGDALAANANSQYIETLERQHKDYRTYFGKLEMEIFRLGGNPQELRMGAQIFLARVFKKMLYLDFRVVIFSHYEKVYDKINELSALILSWNYPLPDWDMVVHDGAYPPLDDPVFSKHDGPDKLALRLVEGELVRLLNQLNKLTQFVRVQHDTIGLLGKDQLEMSTEAIWNDRNAGATQVMFDAYEMMERLAVEYPKVRQLEGTTAQRRHPIYVEMFKIMQHLNTLVYEYNKIRVNLLPAPGFDALPPVKPFKRRTYEMLVNDLTKYEINVLHHHVKQQLAYVTTLMFPGTETGMKELKDDWKGPDFERKFIHQSISIISRAKKLAAFWDKTPKPGSIAEIEFPDLSTSSSSSSEEEKTSKKDIHKDWSKNDDKEKSKSKLQTARKDVKDKKDRIKQLQNLIKRNGKHVFVKSHDGNFTGQSKGTSELDRFKAENTELFRRVKEIEKLCTDTYKLTLPKWPKKGGSI